jgi:molecular chaperone DnaK
MIDEEFKQAFSPSARSVNVTRLQQETDYLHRLGKRQLEKLLKNEKYEESAPLQRALNDLEAIQVKLRALSPDDVTDTKYQLDDQKRRLAQIIDTAEKGDRMVELKEEYYYKKEECRQLLQQTGHKDLQHRLDTLIAEENTWISNCSTQFLRLKIGEMGRLTWDIRRKDVSYVTRVYMYYAALPDDKFYNIQQVKTLRARGNEALGRQNPDEILSYAAQMHELLIDKDQNEAIKGTGLKG